MKNFLRVTFNQRTQILLVITLFIAMLFMLGVWSSLSMVKAVDGSPVELDNTGSWVGYQVVSGTLTYTMYMPFMRREPTPTATQSPIIFFDDFSSANSGWITGESGDCKFEYRDGRYRITVKDDGGVRCVSFNTRIPKTINGIFSVSVRRTTDNNRELRYGFYFGAGTKAEEDRWFLEVEPHKVDECDDRGFFWVSAIEDGRTEFFHARCTSSVRTNTNDWNDLKVVRNGRDIDIYINGERKEDYNEDVLRDKGFFDLVVVGVNDISDSRPGIVEFDNFLIQRLP